MRRLRIENDRLEVTADSVRRVATVSWEDSPRPPLDLHFEISSSRAGDLSDSFDAFLLAAALAASRHGERRIRVEGRLCPRLVEGVLTAFALLGEWYPGRRDSPAIEAAAGMRASSSGRNPAAALWLTAGVDSLHVLRENRRMYAPSHPRSFRRAIHVPHLNFPGGDNLPPARDLLRRQLRSVKAVAAETGLDLIVVGSNQRLLEPDLFFPGREALGSLLASTAHFQSAALRSATVAASLDLTRLPPLGSHPLLDPLFSSASLDIFHEGWGRTRMEKVRDLARWGPLRHVFVCFEGPLPDGQVNCGRCEKCVRTMTALVAVGALSGHPGFPADDVTPEMIRGIDAGYHPDLFEYDWGPLASETAAAGREDLARAIRRRVERVRAGRVPAAGGRA